MHFDPQLTRNFKTNTMLSFVYSKLLRHKVGADVQPGTFLAEPDLAERSEAPNDITYLFKPLWACCALHATPLSQRGDEGISSAATPSKSPLAPLYQRGESGRDHGQQGVLVLH